MTATVASFSGGKDSTAMVLRMVETGDDLDEVIYCDTGLEFPAMYSHIRKVSEALEQSGVKFTVLKGARSFHEYFVEKLVESSAYGTYHGYGWPNMHMRWCTKHLKTEVIDKYLKGKDIVMCTGLAADEARRIQKSNNRGHRHPLQEWGWTEQMCLGYCYGKGYDWYDPTIGKGLYQLFDRTSCYLCPLGTVDNYRTLRTYYPDLWESIGKLEAELRDKRRCDPLPGTWRYTPKRSWQEMDDRFAREDLGIKSRTVLEDFI